MTPDRIKAIRARLGLSQDQFAAKLGVSPSTVEKWEQGQTSPRGLSMQALEAIDRDTQPRTAPGMSAKTLTWHIRHEGLMAVANAVSSPTGFLHRGLADGWDLRGWELTQTGGAALFAHYADPPPPTDPEIVALEAERRELERLESRNRGASYHHAEVRKQVDAAQNRINQIGHRLKEIDPRRIAQEIGDLRRIVASQQNAADRGDERVEWYRGEVARLSRDIERLTEKLASFPPAPARIPVEAVLCLNADRTPEWEAEFANPPYPTIVLYKSGWLPQSGIPIQPEESPF